MANAMLLISRHVLLLHMFTFLKKLYGIGPSLCVIFLRQMHLTAKLGTLSQDDFLFRLRDHMLQFPDNIAFLSLKIGFVFSNTAEPDEMPLYATFHLGLQCLPKYRFKGFRSSKG